jgi:uncharacterized repeat protein (TIGR04138 family)
MSSFSLPYFFYFAEKAKADFGGMARGVLEDWGFHSTADIGRVIFALVDVGYFVKTAEDDPSDFNGLYDFAEMFEIRKVIEETVKIP